MSAMPSPGKVRSTSALGLLTERLDSEAEKRIEALSERDTLAVVTWLEAKQLEIAMRNAMEDDALASAKDRGAVEFILRSNGELVERLRKRKERAAAEAKEEVDDE